ncbi:hypothetical protein ACFRFL_14050 [Streptomyces sp. NPDC056708]|uniref:hypothetical protein n=1 Tax=unclassified Streptomyces TaxID=2593676 RepID=UPI0036BCB1AB
MYDVTIQHPAIDDRQFSANGPGDLRNVVWGVARIQARPVTEADSSEMIAEVGALWSKADIEGAAQLEVHEITVKVTPAAGPSEDDCNGHENLYAGVGEALYCDGACQPRPRRFTAQSLLDLMTDISDAELDAAGGCGACGLEADEKCVGCGRCNCSRHDNCVRPAAEAAAR